MEKSSLFRALEIDSNTELKALAKEIKIPYKRLQYYSDKGKFPQEEDAKKLCEHLNIDILELKIKLGILDKETINAIQSNSDLVRNLINQKPKLPKNHHYAFSTDLGEMYQGDCVSLMNSMQSESVDLFFADPPFNLDKEYESGYKDKLSEEEYSQWMEKWLLEAIRILKPGGSMFIWNLPKWNTDAAGTLNKYLEFKHWIAVDIKYRLPIKNRLYPSHYGLLYYTKGEKANTFNETRIPLEICRHCAGDIRDYGGYKNKLNVKGMNLTDVWYDIPPVRHGKFKTRGSNELSLKLMERIISLASKECDTIFDPFGGSGTTYVTAEILNRKWIGVEIGSTKMIEERFTNINWQAEYIKKLQDNKNKLFTESMKTKRLKNGHWLPETLQSKEKKDHSVEQITLNF